MAARIVQSVWVAHPGDHFRFFAGEVHEELVDERVRLRIVAQGRDPVGGEVETVVVSRELQRLRVAYAAPQVQHQVLVAVRAVLGRDHRSGRGEGRGVQTGVGTGVGEFGEGAEGFFGLPLVGPLLFSGVRVVGGEAVRAPDSPASSSAGVRGSSGWQGWATTILSS